VTVPFASRGGGGPPRGVVRLGTSDSTDAVLQNTPSLEVIRRRGEAQAQVLSLIHTPPPSAPPAPTGGEGGERVHSGRSHSGHSQHLGGVTVA
jgi:hypothetical protein